VIKLEFDRRTVLNAGRISVRDDLTVTAKQGKPSTL
jgi:hypothetical protein